MIAAILAGIAIGVVLGIVGLLVVADRVERAEQAALDQAEYEPQRDPVLDRIHEQIARERLARFEGRVIELQQAWRQVSFGPPRWRVSDDLAMLFSILQGATFLVGWPVFVDHDLPPDTLLIEPDPVALAKAAGG